MNAAVGSISDLAEKMSQRITPGRIEGTTTHVKELPQ
jgi:hypothetical protein